MSTKYTPWPWALESETRLGGSERIITTGDGGASIFWPPGSRFGVASEEEQDNNTRLAVASVNSYAKHCGDHAVECAEEDLLGQALDALEKCARVLKSEDRLRGWLETTGALNALAKAGRK